MVSQIPVQLASRAHQSLMGNAFWTCPATVMQVALTAEWQLITTSIATPVRLVLRLPAVFSATVPTVPPAVCAHKVITSTLTLTVSPAQQGALPVQAVAYVKSACQGTPCLSMLPRASVSLAHRHVRPVLSRQTSA